jgi:hypothetical protein
MCLLVEASNGGTPDVLECHINSILKSEINRENQRGNQDTEKTKGAIKIQGKPKGQSRMVFGLMV